MKDTNVLAAHIVGEATKEPSVVKNPAAVALGRLGGLKGGRARAENLTSERRLEIAKKAAQARWSFYEKSNFELAIDNLLLLRLLDILEPIDDIDMLKLEKLVFLVEKDQQSHREKGFNFLFYRWVAGPYSNDLYDLVDTFVEDGVLTRQPLRLTVKGHELLRGYQQHIKKTDPIVKHMSNILETYSHYSPTALRDLVYGMDIVPTGEQTPINIRNARSRKRFLMKIPNEKCESRLPMTDIEAATFLVESNPNLMASLHKAREH